MTIEEGKDLLVTANSKFELIIGPSREYYYFKEEIGQRINHAENLEYDFIYFLPVKRAVRYFKDQLIDISAKKVLADPPVYTFYQFMTEFYRSLPGSRKIVSPTMRLFLVEESLKKSIEKLRFFSASSAKRRGLIRKVDSLLMELREYGYTSESLLKNLDKDEQDDFRIFDFAICIEEFEKLLGDALIDEAGAIQSVIKRLEGDFWQKRFPSVKTVYLSGYGLFSRPMIRFIEQIRNVCSVKIKLDYLPEHPQLFSHLDPAMEQLSNLKPLVIQEKQSRTWETQLFQRKPANQPLLNLYKDVLIQPANNREEEVVFIANYVKRLHHYHKIPIHQIGITFPSLELYAPLIHEIFLRLGLPYNLSTGYQLSQSPLIRGFMLMLETPLLGYEIKKLRQLLSSPFFCQPVKNAVDVNFLKSLATETRITHLQGDWDKTVTKHIERLKQQVKEFLGDDKAELQQLRRKIQKYTKGIKALKALLENIHRLEERQSIKDFRAQYLQLLGNWGFLDWYKEENKNLSPQEKEREYRAFNRFNKLLDQFSWIVTNLHGEQKLNLKDFYQYLRLLVTQAAYNLREWPDLGVQIMPRLEVLSLTPKVLIFGGMIEGDFPRPFTQDIFLHDEKRQELGLAATEDLLAQDRFLFYQILSSQVEKLVFTYPRFQKEAARVPSNFLNVLAEQTKVNWRKKSPSAQFLQNQRVLLTQTACRIPGGLHDREKLKLRKWAGLTEASQDKNIMTQFWLHRVRTNYSKRNRRGFNDYEGMLNGYPDIINRLVERYQDHAFSITRLETYAFCPIQFFFRNILRVEEEQDVEQGLAAIERGQMVHKTLFRFYRELKETHQNHQPWEALPLLEKIAREEFDNLPFKGMLFDLEKEKYFGVENSPGLWQVFLEVEQNEINQLHFYPQYFEVAFGHAGNKTEQDNISTPEPITIERNGKQIKLVGKVDRIDINDQGKAILLDYKTGTEISKAPAVLSGISLQLPIYAAVLPELLKNVIAEPVQPVMTTIYQVKNGENCHREPQIFDNDASLNIKAKKAAALPNKNIVDENGHQLTFAEMLDRSEGQVFNYIERISNGEFRHTRFPDEVKCQRYCQFRRVCRKDIRKLKNNRELENQ